MPSIFLPAQSRARANAGPFQSRARANAGPAQPRASQCSAMISFPRCWAHHQHLPSQEICGLTIQFLSFFPSLSPSYHQPCCSQRAPWTNKESKPGSYKGAVPCFESASPHQFCLACFVFSCLGIQHLVLGPPFYIVANPKDQQGKADLLQLLFFMLRSFDLVGAGCPRS